MEAGAAVRMHHAYPAFLYTIPDTPGNRALVSRHSRTFRYSVTCAYISLFESRDISNNFTYLPTLTISLRQASMADDKKREAKRVAVENGVYVPDSFTKTHD